METCSLKVLSFNINGCLRGIVDEILQQDPDLIALQEVPRHVSSELHNELQSTTSQVWYMLYSEADYLGNAVYSKFPFSSTHCIVMSETREARSAAIVQIPIKSIFPFSSSDEVLQFVSIHLDHVSEACRIAQFESFLSSSGLLSDPVSSFVILAGDFNALCKSDYSSRRWNEIRQIRRDNRWEDAVTDLMTRIMSRFEFKDSLRESRYDQTLQSNLVCDLDYEIDGTCRFHTRIDYILSRSFIKAGETVRIEVVPSSYKTVSSTISDHSMICASFSFKFMN